MDKSFIKRIEALEAQSHMGKMWGPEVVLLFDEENPMEAKTKQGWGPDEEPQYYIRFCRHTVQPKMEKIDPSNTRYAID
jgi:hypothetical protein